MMNWFYLLFLLLSVSFSWAGDITEFLIINETPFTCIFTNELSPNPQMGKFLPTIIAPNSATEFIVQNADLCRTCSYQQSYTCVLGYKDLFAAINAGTHFLNKDWRTLFKEVGQFHLSYQVQEQTSWFYLDFQAPVTDFANIPDEDAVYRLQNFDMYAQGQANGGPWTSQSMDVTLSGTDKNIHITLHRTQPQFYERPFTMDWARFTQAWYVLDPTEDTYNYLDELRTCIFQFTSPMDWVFTPVFDGFNSEYNAIGWTLNMTKDANILDPLRGPNEAIAFYNKHNYIKTPCSEDVDIVLYCIQDQNGDCKPQPNEQINENLIFTHAARKLRDLDKWSSKFGNGPLVVHKSMQFCDPDISSVYYGEPNLCFRAPYDIEVHIKNISPYFLILRNKTNYAGDWDPTLIPSSVIPYSTSSFAIRSSVQSDFQIWYEIYQQSTSLGEMGFTATTSEEWEIDNRVTLYAPDVNLVSLNYFGKAGNSQWIENSVPIDGYPLQFNLEVKIADSESSNTHLQNILLPPHESYKIENFFLSLKNLDDTHMISDFDPAFNALGWTVGDSKFNDYAPFTNYDMLMDFYLSYNFTETLCNDSNIKIAVYCQPSLYENMNGGCRLGYNSILGFHNYTHAALKLPNGTWSSKFWDGPVFMHSELSSINQSKDTHSAMFAIGQLVICFTGPPVVDEKPEVIVPTANTDTNNILTLTNPSIFTMTLSTARWSNFCKRVWFWERCTKQLYGGIDKGDGTWALGREPDPILEPLINTLKVPYTLEDSKWYFLRKDWTQYVITYEIYLGDYKRYHETNPKYLKRFPDKSIWAYCGATNGGNIVQGTRVQDISYWTETYPKHDRDYTKNLIQGNLTYFSTTPADNGVWHEGTININGGGPLQVNWELRNVEKTLEVWIDAIFDLSWDFGLDAPKRHEAFSDLANLLDIWQDIDWNPPLWGDPDPSKYKFNCTIPANKKVCGTRVLDDFDDNYNCAAWALGITHTDQTSGHNTILENKINAITKLSPRGYTVVDCWNQNPKKWNDEVTLAFYCNIDQGTGKCIPLGGYEFSHVAMKSSIGWTSKLASSPLILHDHPTDLENTHPKFVTYTYGTIVFCMKGKSWLDDQL